MEYHIPDEATKGFLVKILDIMRQTPTVVPFTYSFDTIDPLIMQLQLGKYDYTLAQFRQIEKYFELHECCVLLLKCVEAAKPLADRGMFFGGYEIEDFVFTKVDGHYIVFVEPVVEKILGFLGGRNDYFDTIHRAPELAQGIYTEKADIWSLGIVYKKFLAFYRSADMERMCEDAREVTPQFISNSLQIHDMQAIHIMSEFLRRDWKLRPGYEQVLTCFHNMKVKCTNESYCFIRNALRSATFDSYLTSLGYELVKKLGEGSFGEVFLAEDTQGKFSAFKFICIESQIAMNKYSSEATTTIQASSDYVIRLLNVSRAAIGTGNYLVLELEYAPYGDLRNFLLKYGHQLSMEQRLSLAAKIAIAIHHLHSLGKIHRDIKPDNILVSDNYVPKLADFGSNELLFDGQASDSFSGSFGYLAPEVIRGDKATEKVDVWSFGVMFHEIVFGVRADEEMMTSDNPVVESVLDGCLQEDPKERLSSEQVAQILSEFEDISFEQVRTLIELQFSQDSSFESSLESVEVLRSFTFSAIPSLKV